MQEIAIIKDNKSRLSLENANNFLIKIEYFLNKRKILIYLFIHKEINFFDNEVKYSDHCILFTE